MKTILVLCLSLLVQQSFASERSQCTAQANQLAQEAFNTYLDSIPNSSSPDGLAEITGADRIVNGEAKFSTRGEYFTYVKYGFSYHVQVRVSLLLGADCSVRGKSLTEKILNIEPPADEKLGTIPCYEEVGLVCGKGMVDRCVYPKAETHHCVPNVRSLGGQESPPSPATGGM